MREAQETVETFPNPTTRESREVEPIPFRELGVASFDAHPPKSEVHAPTKPKAEPKPKKAKRHDLNPIPYVVYAWKSRLAQVAFWVFTALGWLLTNGVIAGFALGGIVWVLILGIHYYRDYFFPKKR